MPFEQKYKLASKEFKKQPTIIQIKDQKIGGNNPIAVIAGPCAIESEQQIFSIAGFLAQHSITILRGGAFKPRTSPYDFQGLGKQGLVYLRDAAREYNLLSISEVMDTREIELMTEHVDIIQIGARNMQNYNLLKEAGKINKPVLLKRGQAATYQDLLMAAEYILVNGNPQVILCERGIRTFENYTRNTLDICAVPVLHELSHLPVIVDPSHGTGMRQMIAPMARAAVAAGADGIMIEVHPEPDKALSDAKQAVSLEDFADIMASLKVISHAIKSL